MAVVSNTRSRARRSPKRFKIKRETVAGQQADLLLKVRAQDGLSRVDLARSLNLAPSTVGIYVDHLVEEGFLCETKAVGRDFGRPPTILALNPQGGRFIGVDFEARNIMAVAVDFSQRPLKQVHETINADDTVEDILRKIEQAITSVGAGDGRKVLGIGVGVPGVIDPARGLALSYKHIKGWVNVPLVSRLEHRFGVPVFVENNTRTMAMAELWFGQGRGLRNFICVGVRSGLGAGIIIDGQVYRGADNRAGEIGDWPLVLTDGENHRGSTLARTFARLEDLTSLQPHKRGVAVSAFPAPHSWRRDSLESLRQAALAGDKALLGSLDRVAHVFGLVLNQLNCMFNPEKIIVAGAFTVFGDIFLKRLQESLTTFAPPGGAPVVVNSQLGPFNGAIGAAALAVHEWRPVPP